MVHMTDEITLIEELNEQNGDRAAADQQFDPVSNHNETAPILTTFSEKEQNLNQKKTWKNHKRKN